MKLRLYYVTFFNKSAKEELRFKVIPMFDPATTKEGRMVIDQMKSKIREEESIKKDDIFITSISALT